MSKKKLKNLYKIEKQKEPQLEVEISKNGWKIIKFSILGLICGFILLSFTNPAGDNLASILSPIIIIVSYIFIAVGIISK